MEKRQRASQQHFSVDLLEFFDVNDALDVTWAHAVNSQSHPVSYTHLTLPTSDLV